VYWFAGIYVPEDTHEHVESAPPEPPHFLPRVSPIAPINEVMWEQLAYLMNHGTCDPSNCPECYRYGQVRAILLEPFIERAKRV
jgi:hypothetical protein